MRQSIHLEFILIKTSLGYNGHFSTTVQLPLISHLLRDRLNQDSSEQFAKDFCQSYMSYLIWKVSTRSKIEHFHIRYDMMIDWNLLQTAQRNFDLNGRITVKLMVILQGGQAQCLSPPRSINGYRQTVRAITRENAGRCPVMEGH